MALIRRRAKSRPRRLVERAVGTWLVFRKFTWWGIALNALARLRRRAGRRAILAGPLALVLLGGAALALRFLRPSARAHRTLDVDGPNQSAPGQEIPTAPAPPAGRPEVPADAPNESAPGHLDRVP